MILRHDFCPGSDGSRRKTFLLWADIERAITTWRASELFRDLRTSVFRWRRQCRELAPLSLVKTVQRYREESRPASHKGPRDLSFLICLSLWRLPRPSFPSRDRDFFAVRQDCGCAVDNHTVFSRAC